MRILIVDDELHVLEGLKRMLSGMKEITHMELAVNGLDALQKLEQASFDLVICDLHMPGLTGVQVLERVRKLTPETIRFILTGMIDHPLHHAALRLAHQMIAKPCRPEVLQELIFRALRLKRSLSGSSLCSVLGKLQSLPSLPKAFQQVIEYLSQPTASCRGLSRLIGEDVGMTARIMQLANSAYYGRPGKVHNAVQAIIYLGMKTVEAMVLRQGVFSRIDPALADRFGASALEAHSMRVGMAARRICLDLSLPADIVDQVVMAGILHDTGKIIMISKFTEQFEQALQKSRHEKIELADAEQQICGFTHAEVGAVLLNLWSLPQDIIETAAFHHVPWLLNSQSLAGRSIRMPDVVYMADCIDHQYCSSRSDGYTHAVAESFLDDFGLAEQYHQWRTDHLSALCKEPSYAEV